MDALLRLHTRQQKHMALYIISSSLVRALRSSGRRLRAVVPLSAALSAPCAGFSKWAGKMVEENGHYQILRVLFCGFEFPASHTYTKEYLANYPFVQVDAVARKEVPNVIHKYHVCVVKMCHLNSKVIARAVQMKLIVQYGVGLEGVDIDAATRHSIRVARIPGNSTGNSASCAEMALYMMLGLLRKQAVFIPPEKYVMMLGELNREKKEMEIAVKQRSLGEPIGETLLGKTVFIMGFGAIGVDLAKRLRPFGVKILATKRQWTTDLLQPSDSADSTPGLRAESDVIASLVDKRGSPKNNIEFAAEADIVVTCLILNSETAGIVNGEFLSSMKKGSLLVNVARGGLLDYKSVYEYLESGHLGGLAIDVAWQEPFDPEDPILKFPNVLITPHVAGVTEQSYRSMAKVVGDAILQLHAGSPLTGIEIVN